MTRQVSRLGALDNVAVAWGQLRLYHSVETALSVASYRLPPAADMPSVDPLPCATWKQIKQADLDVFTDLVRRAATL
jgi:hypothetical protein